MTSMTELARVKSWALLLVLGLVASLLAVQTGMIIHPAREGPKLLQREKRAREGAAGNRMM